MTDEEAKKMAEEHWEFLKEFWDAQMCLTHWLCVQLAVHIAKHQREER